MEETSIAVVDDHTLFRKGLVSLLTKSKYSFRVVWEASSGAEFLDKMAVLVPDGC